MPSGAFRKFTIKNYPNIYANFLRDAEKILNAEFSLVLNIPQDAVFQYIQNVFRAN